MTTVLLESNLLGGSDGRFVQAVSQPSDNAHDANTPG